MKWYHWFGLGIGGILIWKRASAVKTVAPAQVSVPVPVPAIVPISLSVVADAATQVAADNIKTNPNVPPATIVAVVADAAADLTKSPASSWLAMLTAAALDSKALPQRATMLCYKPMGIPSSTSLSGADLSVRASLLRRQCSLGRVSPITAQKIRTTM